MSDYVGGGLALLAIVAAIVGVLYFSGNGPGEGSIIPEAVAATSMEADYGWKVASPSYGDGGEVTEYY